MSNPVNHYQDSFNSVFKLALNNSYISDVKIKRLISFTIELLNAAKKSKAEAPILYHSLERFNSLPDTSSSRKFLTTLAQSISEEEIVRLLKSTKDDIIIYIQKKCHEILLKKEEGIEKNKEKELLPIQEPTSVFKLIVEDETALKELGSVRTICDRVVSELDKRKHPKYEKYAMDVHEQWMADISTETCDYLVEKGVISAWNYFIGNSHILVKISPNDPLDPEWELALRFPVWRDKSSIEKERMRHLARPPFDRFSGHEAKLLHKACNWIEHNLATRNPARPDTVIQLRETYDCGIKTTSMLSSVACDYLVETGIIHSWSFDPRVYVIYVKMSPNDKDPHEEFTPVLPWRDINVIQSERLKISS